MSRQTGRESDKGYSLVELLAVTAVLALVLSAVFMFYENVLRAFARDTSQVEAQQNVRVALDFITSDLHLANWLETRHDGGGSVLDYRLPGENFRWTIRRRPEDNTLLRERRPILQGGAVGAVDNTVMLASHITAFSVVPPTGTVFTWKVTVTASFGGRQFTMESTVSPRNLR
ncbi:MAG: prepilin-type N-terminal cleavage/methylation domain-containing protein [Firmicutes bacterium]|nr:prepilin-type N-terminal cleavage/methylation domain-containing protein [Bacillota bacterium]